MIALCSLLIFIVILLLIMLVRLAYYDKAMVKTTSMVISLGIEVAKLKAERGIK